MKNKLKDNQFLWSLLTLVIPITLQNLISSSLNMIDNLMIGRLGESSIAAVGLVNQYFFIFMLCITGINAGAGIFMSRFWGREDVPNIRKMLGLDIILSIIVSIIFFIPSVLFPETIMKIFLKDAEVIHLGVQYLRVISVTFTITAITQIFSTTLRCIGIARPAMFGSLIGIVVNAVLNWILIFGHFGFPALGVVGAGIATSIARLIEMIFVVISAYRTNDVISSKPKELFDFGSGFVKTYFRTSSAVIINEIVWVLGLTFFSVIYAKIGIRQVASMQIATTINNMFMVLGLGLAHASAIIIGNQIGAGDEEMVIDYALKLGILSPIIGLVTGIGLWILSPFIVGVFNINPDTISMTINVLRIMAVFTPLRFFNLQMILGVFRGGGDTTYAMLLQLGTIWGYAIPAGYIAAVYFKMPLEAVFFLITSEELVRIIFSIRRLRSKKWMKSVE